MITFQAWKGLPVAALLSDCGPPPVVVLLFILVSVSLSSPCGAQAPGSLPAPNNSPIRQEDSPFRLRVNSNLVVVRVVVRDSNGQAIDDLRRENFKLLDMGREQDVSQFSVDKPMANIAAGPTRNPSSTPQSNAIPTVAPPRLIVLYIDDLNLEAGDISSCRQAVYRFLEKNLSAFGKVAVFTSSGSVHTFVTELGMLHEILSKVVPIAPVSAPTECPHLSDYLAERIAEHKDEEAISVALIEANLRNCHFPADETGNNIVLQRAKAEVNEYRERAQRSLDGLNQIINWLAQFPGQRQIVVASDGFLARQEQVDAAINRALQSSVVIGSLDAKGIQMFSPEVDLSLQGQQVGEDAMERLHLSATARDSAATSALLQIAVGTAGRYIHNDNDLSGGFARLAEEPISYTLAFRPANCDGKFHKLEVKLVHRPHGDTVQARHGYFAPQN